MHQRNRFRSNWSGLQFIQCGFRSSVYFAHPYWYVLLYCSGPVEGHMYDHELFYLCICDEAGQAGVQLEFPFYPDHVVVGQLHS